MMRCKHMDYPFGLWIKQSFVFALTATLLIALASFTGGFMSTRSVVQICITFLVILIVAFNNICIHVYFRVEDPVKSPLYVKVISFGSAILIIWVFHYIERFLGVLDHRLHSFLIQNPVRNFTFISVQGSLLNVVVLLWLYFLMSEHAKAHHKLERSRLERSREEAINLMMRQQIQPHFLFNALATLKTLIRKNPDMAQDYLVQLSDFLRITIASVKNGELASIDQEIKLCEDYLNMQKIRFGEALHYEVNISADIREKQLPIFSIQPLVDNVLKHNSFTVADPVRISVAASDGWIFVRNNKNIKYQKVDSNGSGLRNLIERYKYLFVQGVEIEESEAFFEVRIKIV